MAGAGIQPRDISSSYSDSKLAEMPKRKQGNKEEDEEGGSETETVT
jgi:hypothetical protein